MLKHNLQLLLKMVKSRKRQKLNYGQKQIQDRLETFQRDKGREGFSVSIKFQAPRCFCRDHCAPEAYRLIDDYLTSHPLNPKYCECVEHETGPEVVVYIVTGVAFITSLINLVAAILKACSDGQKKGDKPCNQLIIVIRGFNTDNVFYEKQILKVNPEIPPTKNAIKESLMDVIQQIAEERARQK
jgi:hypothetical protein